MRSDPTPSTAQAVSPDSGLPWAEEGAWPVAAGVHRIPLPLPSDALRAVNVYVLETTSGLTLVDGGWGIEAARTALESGLAQLGAGFGDIDRFLVTHVHRDHYTLAAMLSQEHGTELWLGSGDRPSLDMLERRAGSTAAPWTPFADALTAAGIPELIEAWSSGDDAAMTDAKSAGYTRPTGWLEGDHRIELGTRALDAVHTPGHTPGHFVFVEPAAGTLYAGDHVLPTITPSIGFVAPAPVDPLGDFMRSLTKVRALPDLRVLPAHGPVAESSHRRVDELLAHHEERLDASLAAVSTGGSSAADVAAALPWTRHLRAFAALEPAHRGMAALETKAHLDLLVARGSVTVAESGAAAVYRRAGEGEA
jgi:glyoxylase-like metal-dependent hydrolase (beta-lactamase superfamily II)